jgi:hypothetical protein
MDLGGSVCWLHSDATFLLCTGLVQSLLNSPIFLTKKVHTFFQREELVNRWKELKSFLILYGLEMVDVLVEGEGNFYFRIN